MGNLKKKKTRINLTTELLIPQSTSLFKTEPYVNRGFYVLLAFRHHTFPWLCFRVSVPNLSGSVTCDTLNPRYSTGNLKICKNMK